MQVPVIDPSKPIAVTGATGYVAGWVIKLLLEQGFSVHATVRDSSEQRVGYLNELAASLPGELHFFEADLLEQGAFDAPFAGCELVYHTASPFTLSFKDPQRELVDPALKGTRNVLESVNRSESVKRVVLTSSCAAIYGDNADAMGLQLNEGMWNTSSSLSHNPYSYSKTVAERAAWEMHAQQQRWQLITINPSFVLGPGIKPIATSESFNIVKQMGDGTMKVGLPHVGMCAVDVRDLAQAQLKAGLTAAAKGRYIISGHDSSFLELAGQLLDKYGDQYPIPRRRLPKWLMMCIGPLAGMSRQYVRRNVDYSLHADNSKSRMELDMEYRPLKQTMEDFFQQLIENGVFSK
ncbi:NAD-dependent epimerase/dehydratase family protein [Aliagarivorans marinus]|uniref:NAD-dependent epimerase/dehydratase family protein n=1 Tax=Aliagarivorans marinus TaxID=561965 RepID=UPI000404C07A|nr:NAD-dependent epimerase/dehydratase family protein [Aliagarivorans marinus]